MLNKKNDLFKGIPEKVKEDCRLCKSTNRLLPLRGIDERGYYFCENCHLINVHRKHLPDKQTEKERYLTHQNGVQFEGYVKFLYQAVNPALNFIKKNMVGLDYGCGPVPTLSKLLNKEGYACEDYDPYFVKHDLGSKFGFIFSTEVFEHFFNPDKEIKKIRSLLREDGVLVVMTERWKDPDHFFKWYYARDNSHVCFYHSRTFDYICDRFGLKKVFDDGQRVVILKDVYGKLF